MLPGDNNFTKAGPSNILQSSEGLSCVVEYSFRNNNPQYQILVWHVAFHLCLTKKLDSTDFRGKRTFRDHLHAFDRLWIALKKVKHFAVLNCSSFFEVEWKPIVLNRESLFLLMVSDNSTDRFESLFSIKLRNCLSPTSSSSYKLYGTVSGTKVFVSKSNRSMLSSSSTDSRLFTCLWKFVWIDSEKSWCCLGSYFH